MPKKSTTGIYKANDMSSLYRVVKASNPLLQDSLADGLNQQIISSPTSISMDRLKFGRSFVGRWHGCMRNRLFLFICRSWRWSLNLGGWFLWWIWRRNYFRWDRRRRHHRGMMSRWGRRGSLYVGQFEGTWFYLFIVILFGVGCRVRREGWSPNSIAKPRPEKRVAFTTSSSSSSLQHHPPSLNM